MFIELYMEVTLFTCFNLKALEWETDFKAVIFNNSFLIVATVAIITVPVALIVYSACKYSDWKDQAYQRRYGTVLEGFDLNKERFKES